MKFDKFLRGSFLLAATGFALLAQVDSKDGDKTAEPQEPKIDWQKGPTKARLGDIAEIDVPAGYLFADVANTKKLLDMTHNIPTGKELGSVVGAKDGWFAIFEFDPVGYVKDDEKDKLDADKLLKSIQDSTEEANKERREKGWDPFYVTGWIEPPHYDSRTHQLTWSIVGHGDKGGQSANYMTRALGRRGVMEITLIAAPEKLNAVLPAFQTISNANFRFTRDQQYSAFVKGDKVAEYGLSALILGGAAAAALKTGFFKYLLKLAVAGWKLIVLGFGAFMAFLKRLFGGRKSSSSSTADMDTSSSSVPTATDV